MSGEAAPRSDAASGGSARVTILFIAGAGRSGSTLLDRSLGTLPGAASGTELNGVWRKGLAENHLCTCGQPFRRCPYWHEVIRRAFPGRDEAALVNVGRRVASLQRRVVRTRRMPAVTGLSGSRGFRAELAEYRSAVHALYLAVAEVTGSGVVVDSSKMPVEAFVLAGIPELDVRMVHLVRDPRAVAHSWQRRRVDPGHGTALSRIALPRVVFFWTLRNAAAELARRRMPYIRVNYEEFIRDPVGAAARILAAVPALAGQALDVLPGSRIDLPLLHAISGNPNRFGSGPTALELDDAWRTRMSAPRRWLITGLTLPLLVRYGYVRPSAMLSSNSRYLRAEEGHE